MILTNNKFHSQEQQGNQPEIKNDNSSTCGFLKCISSILSYLCSWNSSNSVDSAEERTPLLNKTVTEETGKSSTLGCFGRISSFFSRCFSSHLNINSSPINAYPDYKEYDENNIIEQDLIEKDNELDTEKYIKSLLKTKLLITQLESDQGVPTKKI